MSDNYDKAAEAGNELRRGAVRHKIDLRSPVIITAVAAAFGAGAEGEGGKEQYLVLEGHLLNVSLTGLALVISGDDLPELRKLGNDPVMRLLLPLPKESVELEASPVRYETLEGGQDGKVLVGAQIIDMNGRDRIVFMDFIYAYCESAPGR